MELIDCPHCFTRVVPREDGTCPACQRDTRDTRGCDLDRTPLRIAQGDVLPAICCDCGQPTHRLVRVCRKIAGDPNEPSAVIKTMVLVLFSWLIGVYMFLRGMSRTKFVEVSIPQCEECGKRIAPQPRYVDFANARMTFIVHKALKDQVRPEIAA